MNKINLDFQQSSNLRWRYFGLVLLAFGILINALLFIFHQQMRNDTLAHDEELRKVQQAANVAPAMEQDSVMSAALRNDLKSAKKMLKQLNAPWPLFFNHLEATTNRNIKLLALNTDVEAGEVHLVGEAEHLNLVIDYLNALKESSLFTDVALSRQVRKLHQGKPVLNFTILMKWKVGNE